MKFEVKNRWSGKAQFTAEISCDEDSRMGIKVGLAVKWAFESDADLRGADLSGADLRGAVLSGAVLRGAGVPVIKDIHQTVYAAATQPGALDMGNWHNSCGTAHCRAGWVVTLAGDAGRAMEFCMGTPAAAAMIYLASDPKIEKMPNFYTDNGTALADMKRLAEQEAAAVA